MSAIHLNTIMRSTDSDREKTSHNVAAQAQSTGDIVMTTTMATQRIEDTVLLDVPPAWEEMPTSVVEGLIWWQLLDDLNKRRKQGGLQAVSPLYDVMIDIARSEQQLNAIHLRHECLTCRELMNHAGVEFRIGERRSVAVCQFAYDVFQKVA